MRDSQQDGPGGGSVLLLVAWHFPAKRRMPRAFWRVRALDRGSRDALGLLWMHRWISMRSVALSSRWRDGDAAAAWLRSERFRAADQAFRAAGAERRVEAGEASLPLGEQLG